MSRINIFFPHALFFLMAFVLTGRHVNADASQAADGMALAASGDYGAADRAFAEELKKRPGDFRLLYNRALAAYSGGQPERARDILLSIAPIERDRSTYHSLLAAVLMRLGEYQKALEPSEKAVKLAPGDASLQLNLGALYLRLRMGEHASKVYRTGRSLFPQLPEFLLGLGVVEQMQAKFDTAETIYRQVIDQFPNKEAGYLYLAHVRIKAGKIEAANQTLEVLLAKTPNSALGHYLAAEAAWATPGEESKAQAHLSEALRLNARLPEGHLLAAKIELRLGDPDLAIRHLKEAENQAPGLATIQYVLSQVYRRVGKIQEAQTAMDRFQKLKTGEGPQLAGTFLVE